MKKALLLTFGFFLLLSSYGQNKEKIKGNKNVTIQESKVSSFNRIVIGEKFKIDLIEGTESSVFIETDDNLHDVIKFNVADSTLYFNTSKRITTNRKMNIKVTFTKTLRHIETIENGEVSSLTSINLDDIVLVHSGSSRAYLNIKCSKFKLINSDKAKATLNIAAKLATLELNENSKTEALIQSDSVQVDLYQRADAEIEGNTDYLNIRADNSTNFIGKKFTANNCELILDLNSDVSVHVVDSLTIEATGNSEVYIYNNPKITLNKFSDTAKLHKKEIN